MNVGFNCTVSRAGFLSELLLAQGIVERKATIPALSHVLLRAQEDEMRLSATDLDISLTSACAAEVTTEGGIAVPAKKLAEIVRSLTGEGITLSVNDNRQLNIKTGTSDFVVYGLSPDDFPVLPAVPVGQPRVALPLASLQGMIKKIFFAVSDQESRFQLNGALLCLDDGAFRVVSTDGHRLALAQMPSEGAKESGDVLVPRKALIELARIEAAEGATLNFARGKDHLSFQVNHREWVTRVLEGTFPDYERVIAKDNHKIVTVDRRPLLDAAQRAALMTGDRSRSVRMDLLPDEIKISAANPDLGSATERVQCDFDGEMKIGFNPEYLIEALSCLATDRVRLELKDEGTQFLIVPVDELPVGARTLSIIMPLRL